MSKRSKRALRQSQRRKKKRTANMIWSGAGLLVIVFLGYLAWNASRNNVGEEVPIAADAGQHVQIGADPGPFTSDPPASGRHYPQEFDAGFYDEGSQEAQVAYPEGYLLHNLEHGYVIFWYNCEALQDEPCETLQDQIKNVMDDFNNFKLIAFPRSSLDVPLVLTTWGRMQRFASFNETQVRNFIKANRNKAPEPNAP